MSQPISRRRILSGGLQTAASLLILNRLGSAAPATSFLLSDTNFEPAFKRLDEFIARHMQEVGAPGMTLALASRAGALRVSQYGFADLKAAVKVGPSTLFEIGSISKSFVALAAVSAAEEGKLDLNKPVISYLPWLKIDSKYSPFTASHLLSHTAGLSGVPLLIRVAATTLRVGWEPGTRFVYSNIGYVLLGFLLEAVDKKPLAEVLRKRVLEPSGMSSSEPVITNNARARMAIGYGPMHEDRPFPLRGTLAEAPWIEVPEAAGSVAATPGDMALYMRMLLNRGAGARGRVVSEKGFELLAKPMVKAPFRGEESSYGLGLWVNNANDQLLLRHTGGMVAFSSAMFVDVAAGFGAFASVNASLGGYRPVAVTKYALDLLKAAAAEKPLPDMPPSLPSPAVVKNAADYAGTFTSQTGGKLVLAANGEQLFLEHKGQRIVLEQAGLDRFIVKHPDFDLYTLAFGRDKGTVVEVSYGPEWWTNDRYAGPKTFDYPAEWNAFVGRFRSDSPWYGSMRIVLRKGRLTLEGEVPLSQIEPGVFGFEGDTTHLERITFDTIIEGRAIHANYSGIDFYRTFTP